MAAAARRGAEVTTRAQAAAMKRPPRRCTAPTAELLRAVCPARCGPRRRSTAAPRLGELSGDRALSPLSVRGLARGPLKPPDPPLSDGEIVLRMRRDADVPVIAEASHDPETRRRLDDEPLTPDRKHDSVARALEQWRTGTGAPFVIADAADDRPLGLLNLQFGEDDEAAGVAVSVFPQARGRGIAAEGASARSDLGFAPAWAPSGVRGGRCG